MLLCFQIILHIVNVTYAIIHHYDSNSYTAWFTITCFATVFICALTFVQTLWVLHRFRIAQISKSIRHRENSASVSIQSRSNNEENDKNVNENGPEILELEIVDVIREEIGFQCFMNHLNKEVMLLYAALIH